MGPSAYIMYFSLSFIGGFIAGMMLMMILNKKEE